MRLLPTALAVLALAGSMTVRAAPDPDALADQLAAHAPQCGTFEQARWLADLDTRLDSRGTFRRQEEGLLWHTTAPIEDRVRLSADNDDLPLSFQVMLPVFTGLLAGQWQSVERHFAIALSGEPTAWQATLTPHEAAVAERLAGLTVSGSTQVDQVVLAFTNGDRLRLQLTPAACQSLDNGGPAS